MIERKTTKRLIADSIMELSRTFDFDKITVADIAKNCAISKRTFYYHFTDKYDALAWIYLQQLAEVFEAHIPEGYGRVLVASAQWVADNSEYVVNTAKNTHGQDSAINIMTKHSTTMYLDYIREQFGQEHLDERTLFEIRNYNRLTLEAYTEWAVQGCPISAELLAEWTLGFMPDGLKPFLMFS